MKGNNELILNQATMIEAVQQYLNTQMVAAAPTVVSVSFTASTYGDGQTFSVQVTDSAPL